MEAYYDPNKTVAFVYLLANGDDKNKALLNDEMLLFIRKGKREIIELKDIANINFETRKVLFPLIVGGIIAPFAVLSYFVNIFLPWFHLISLLLGMLLFYVGWNGRISICIQDKNGDEQRIYIPSISKNLSAFINYTNSILHGSANPALSSKIFFILKDYQQKLLFNDEDNQAASLFPVLGYTYEQVRKMSIPDKSELIMISPEHAGREIKFEYDIETSLMRPKLDGPILPSSREDITHF